MQDNSTSASDMRRTGGRLVIFGIAGILALLLGAALLLLVTLPDAGAFDARVERMFIENADLTSQAAHQQLADLPCAPVLLFAFQAHDHLLNLVRQLVADENRDRSALYREIAVANGHPEWEDEIRATFARRWIANADSGWYYQENDGSWRQK